MRVTPKVSGEHNFEAAFYSYALDDAERHSGLSSNKPTLVDILTKRDFILTSTWHTVIITSIYLISKSMLGIMGHICSYLFGYCGHPIHSLESKFKLKKQIS